MRQSLLLIMALLFLAAPALAVELQGGCRVHFTGSSTLHDFDGTGSCEPFVLKLAEPVDGAAMLPEIVLTVAVAGMQTGNASRDQKMREMFGADRFPRIAGIIGGAPPEVLRRQLHDAARGAQTFPLRLRIREVELTAPARVTQLIDDPKGVSFDLEFPVSLAAYRLEAPSVLGLIRVADAVKVKVTLQLAPLPTPWQPTEMQPPAPR